MRSIETSIPYYADINGFLAAIGLKNRTENPLLYCLRLQDQAGEIYKSPFRRGFYFLAIFTSAGNTRVSHGAGTEENLDSFLVAQSPELIYSFFRDSAADGYLIYFKRECFSFFKPELHDEFTLFNVLHTNLYKFDRAQFEVLAPRFEDVFHTYQTAHSGQHIEARVKLLALLYNLQDFVRERNKTNRLATPQQILLRKYMLLVNNHYLEKQTVQEYAGLLSVTANHLSQSIKIVSGRNALSYITERLMTEAKSLIQFTDNDITQVAYQLNFSDPANFSKFFRKQIGVSPSEYRKSLRQ